MAHLFGRTYTRRELEMLTGTLTQLGGIRLGELGEGRQRGMRVADVSTGSGLRYTVLLDRAMDLGAADFAGKALAWLHPALGGPALYEPQGAGWLRTFGGGLVTTCGLSHFGQPADDLGVHYGLHGRISHIAAEQVQVTQEWRGDDYVLQVAGQTRQAVLFGENLLLKRTIATALGATSFTITDTVRNEGFRSSPHMLLYHCNFGFPVVSPDSELLLAGGSARPRDAAAEAGLPNLRRFQSPDPGFGEQVFLHQPETDRHGFVSAAIVNRALGFGAYVRYRAAELPCLAQWKMLGAGDYVCGLEPATHCSAPRTRLREEGRIRYLAPGEEISYMLEIGVLDGAAAIDAFEQQLAASQPSSQR